VADKIPIPPVWTPSYGVGTGLTPATYPPGGTLLAPIGSGGTGGGTVTSVGLALPAELTVSGSPVTTSGTLTGSWASQLQNLVLASPNGSSGVPTFRALVAADVPALDIHGLAAKTTPASSDEFILADSAASFANKKITFSNLQSAITAGISTLPDFVVYTILGGAL
jgi:hypothetical protein